MKPVCKLKKCGKVLTGRQKDFCCPAHKNEFTAEARRVGMRILLERAVSPDTYPVPIIPMKQIKPHCGNPLTSDRLKRTWAVFREIGNPTTLQIQERTGSMKPSTDVDDLRRAGYPISRAQYVHTTDAGRKVFMYTIVAEEAA